MGHTMGRNGGDATFATSILWFDISRDGTAAWRYLLATPECHFISSFVPSHPLNISIVNKLSNTVSTIMASGSLNNIILRRRPLFNRIPPPNDEASSSQTPNKPLKPSSPELHTTLININDQSESPFFRPQNGIPPEIRDHIYSYAFTDDLDLTKPYDANTHYTRPEHTHKRKTSISLLLACKLIYQEAYSFPLKMKTHTFFYQGERAPPHTINDPMEYFSNLPATQLENLQSFHFFVQQYVSPYSVIFPSRIDLMSWK